MPKITAYHHVTHNISRGNVEAARYFYGTLLGAPEIPATEDPSGERLMWFLVGTQQLHLVIHDDPDAPSSRHFAAVVDDLDAMVDRLSREGVRLDVRNNGTIGIRRDGSRNAFCYDPDGNRIELVGR